MVSVALHCIQAIYYNSCRLGLTNDSSAGVGVLSVAQAHGADFLRRLTILVTVERRTRLMMKKRQIMITSLAFSQTRSS
jgi:hypothetical protein